MLARAASSVASSVYMTIGLPNGVLAFPSPPKSRPHQPSTQTLIPKDDDHDDHADDESEESLLEDCGHSNARSRGAFRPRNANKGTSSYQLRQFAEATLGSGSLRKAVKLPEGEDLNEWLAVNGLIYYFP